MRGRVADTAFKGATLTVGYKTAKAVNVPIVGEVEKLTLATLAPRDMTTIRKGHAG